MEIENSPAFIPNDVWIRAKYFSCSRKIIEYITSNPGEPIRLKHMALVACMERTTLSRAFKSRTGMTLHRFVWAYMVSKAADEMKTSDTSITDIAFRVGFGSLAAFERAFKKVTGTTPSSYRSELLNRNGLLPATIMCHSSMPVKSRQPTL